MFFSESFIASLRDDPVGGTIKICQAARTELDSYDQGWRQSDYETLTEAYALIVELSEAELLPVELDFFEFSGDINNDCMQIHRYLAVIENACVSQASKLRLKSLRSHFKTALGSGFAYEFSQGDLDRVQTLINELRALIANANNLENEHRARLLRRLEKLQSEIHKKVSDLDRFWGLIGDAGVVLGKIGTDAKPIVDRVREIADIVWQTQSRAEELPSGTRIPVLEHREIEDGTRT